MREFLYRTVNGWGARSSGPRNRSPTRSRPGSSREHATDSCCRTRDCPVSSRISSNRSCRYCASVACSGRSTRARPARSLWGWLLRRTNTRSSHEYQHPNATTSEDRSEVRARTGASRSRGMNSDPYVLMAFTMSTVSHGNFGMWRHPADRTAEYTDVRYWVELARLLDDGGFDGLFIADAVGQLDVFGGDANSALSRGIQTPVTDPLLAVSAMAAATEHWDSVSPCRPPMRARICWPGSSARWTISPAAGSAGTSSRLFSTALPATSSRGTGRSHTMNATRSPRSSSR